VFADLWRMMKSGKPHHEKVDTESLAYRGYLYAIAVVPLIGMVAVDFRMMQKTYAVVGALFVPMLAVVLLALNGRAAWIGQRYKNSWATTLILVATTLFFVYAGAIELYDTLFPAPPG
jgi:hypothetical protein